MFVARRKVIGIWCTNGLDHQPSQKKATGVPMTGDGRKRIRIRPLYQDTAVPEPSPDAWIEIKSDDLIEGGPAPPTWGFIQSAEVIVPSLLDLPARTKGDFTELALDLYAPVFPQRTEYLCEVDLRLRGRIIDTKIFHGVTQRHQFVVSTQELFEDFNRLAISVRMIAGDQSAARFFVRAFYIKWERLARNLETRSIWVYSTARSGSTWLTQDILCWNGRTRPMDEPGIGRMFAPVDLVAERFYNLVGKPHHFQSGLHYERKTKVRDANYGIPPFERAFIYADEGNKVWNIRNWPTYLQSLRETVFRHAINEWGVLGYQNLVFKMPNGSHAADVVMQAFPESFMIFLIRDGRDVMKSRFSVFASRDLATTDDRDMRLYAVAFYSHLWNFQVDIIESAFNAHAPGQRLLVRYEDLRREPSQELRTIFSHVCGPITDDELAELIARATLENIPAEQKGPDKPRQTGEIGQYARIFSMQEIELMEAIMGANLSRFGYDLRTDVSAPTAVWRAGKEST
jgi:hypothetical protein